MYQKKNWDRYVDEDEEEEGFDTSAVSFVFYHICHYFVNSSIGYLFCVFVLAVFLSVMDAISPSNISQFSLIDFTHYSQLDGGMDMGSMMGGGGMPGGMDMASMLQGMGGMGGMPGMGGAGGGMGGMDMEALMKQMGQMGGGGGGADMGGMDGGEPDSDDDSDDEDLPDLEES